MTIKNFHIVFIAISTLLCTFFIVWSFLLADDRSPMVLTLGISGIVGLLVLPFYGVCFLRKIRNQHL